MVAALKSATANEAAQELDAFEAQWGAKYKVVMRKYTRNRRTFPNDDAALKSPFLAIRETSKDWEGHPPLETGAAELPVDVRRRARPLTAP